MPLFWKEGAIVKYEKLSGKALKDALCLYAVTDPMWLDGRPLAQDVESALKGGVTMLQLREKTLDDAEFIALGQEIGALCRKYRVPFIVNDNVAVALACGADGVHIGQEDMDVSEARALIGEQRLLGVSAGSLEEAIRAEKDGADYLGVGAMYATDTKKDADVTSIATLKAICQRVRIPVVAIGGINSKTIPDLKGSGVDGMAVVSAIFAQKEIERATRELKKLTMEVLNG
ncbi:MAG: thiamine phosphate synthase [Eubacteriaceae bacterium]|jgi:thiamine-phosphate pyrophosphorylase|nr:thiamine phosphate synthase [Eubacteriaceae bacterium]